MLNENLGFEGSCDVTFDLGSNCKISRIFEKKRDAMYRLVYTCAHACTWRQNPLTTNRAWLYFTFSTKVNYPDEKCRGHGDILRLE